MAVRPVTVWVYNIWQRGAPGLPAPPEVIMTYRFCAPLLVGLLAAGGAVVLGTPQQPWPDAAALQTMTARFAPVDIGADLSALAPGERRALAKLVQAGRVMDALYLRQVWGGNEALLLDLLADESPLGRARLRAFLVNKGPWSELDHNAAFMPGAPEKPAGANFYPAGASKADLEAWLKTLTDAERERATGFFTTIRRHPDGRFTVVPYSVEYQGEPARAAELLREAAAHTAESTLKRFLEARASAFLSNDYYASDVAWMEIDAAIEPTIGPYEVYTDEWFNDKAAFEAFITVRDAAESARLAKFGAVLQDIENHLPVPAEHRNPRLGAMAPIRVVNVVLASGGGNHGVQTAAFNLPNDERVIREKGSKRVMLKNMQDAKFQRVLVPISGIVLASAFRSIRFGINEAHGRGIAVQLNALLDAGAFTVAAGGTFSVNAAAIKPAVEALTREILLLQARGDYAGAKAMIDRLGVVRPEVRRALDRLSHVPVDIEPRFVTAAQLQGLE